MRPDPEFVTRNGPRSAATAASPSGSAPHSPWHSPVPYLFGGLAAMLGLIAFALLILACSYWKISGYLESEGGDSADQHDGGKPGDVSGNPSPAFFEEKILVIMAGDSKPTFLATPIASRANSLVDKAGADAAAATTVEGQETKTEVGTVNSPSLDVSDDNNRRHLTGDDSIQRDYDQSQNNSSQL